MSQSGDEIQQSYLDFELEIDQGHGRTYPVAVVHSPAGEARETMRFPYDELVLESSLKDLQIALLRSGGERRTLLSPEEKAVQDFGWALFDALLTGEIRSRYDVSQQEAAGEGKGLRLKLRIQPPELAALPWEFLYDPRRAEYVCLSRSTPVVRYLELPQTAQPLTVTPPLSILGMIASPSDLPGLNIRREMQRVERSLRHLRSHGLVKLTWLEGQTWRDLQRAMRGGPWHVFHFIGHGGFDHNVDEGFIALADREGETDHLSATQLGRLLADHRFLRLALLNACEGARGSKRDIFSSTASILVRRGLPAVLAMQYEITDRAAIEFARAFYEALADSMPVDAAVAEARKAISFAVDNSIEWGTPVLYMRAPDGVLFTIRGQEKERETIRSGALRLLDVIQEALEARAYDEAVRLAERARQSHPDDLGIRDALVEAYYQKAVYLYTERRFADAVTMFDSALELKPGYKHAVELRHNAQEQVDTHLAPQAGPEARQQLRAISFSSGEGATSVHRWVQLTEQNWEEAEGQLYSGELEEWLARIKEDRLAQEAGDIRQAESRRSIGLERFLRATGLVRAQTKGDVETNIDELIRQLDYSALRKQKSYKSFHLQITHQGRGYLHGTVKSNVSWLDIPKPDFGCLPGQSVAVELVFVPANFSYWRPSFKRPLDFCLE